MRTPDQLPRPVQNALLLCVTALALFSGGCGNKTDAEAATKPEEVLINVHVTPVYRGDIINVIEAVGSLEPVEEVMISSRVPGRIEHFELEVGDAVEADQVVITLEQQEFILAVEQAEAAFRTAKARLEGANLAWNRVKSLGAQDIASSEQLDTARNVVEIAESVVEEAKANLAVAQDQLTDSVIHAPFSGNVAGTMVNPGERVQPGQPLLHIVNLEQVEVDVTVSERRVSEVQLNQPVAVTVDGFPGRTFAGHVHRISPTIDPVSRTFVVTVQLPNNDAALRPGMFARTEIEVGRHEDTLLIDRKAIIEIGGELRVVRVRDGRAQRLEVAGGYQYGDIVEILDGLEIDDVCVTDGAFGIANGAAVSILDETS